MSKGAQIALATLTVFAALVWILPKNGGAFRFFDQISQLTGEDRARAEGLRVMGIVVDGTIARDLQAGYVEFTIRDKNAVDKEVLAANRAQLSVDVRYEGIDVPDMFRDGAEVVVEGGFVQGRFVANKIMAKCPSKYEVAPGVPTESEGQQTNAPQNNDRKAAL